MNNKDGFEYSEKINAERAAEYINQIAEGLRLRSMTLQSREQVMTLTPESSIKLKVKADSNEDKGKIELAISWKVKFTEAEDKLNISTGRSPEPDPVNPPGDTLEKPKPRKKTKDSGGSDE